MLKRGTNAQQQVRAVGCRLGAVLLYLVRAVYYYRIWYSYTVVLQQSTINTAVVVLQHPLLMLLLC